MYMPILRTKQAETAALLELRSETRQYVSPLLVVPPPDIAVLTEKQQREGKITQAAKQGTKDTNYLNSIVKYINSIVVNEDFLQSFLDTSSASPAAIPMILNGIAATNKMPLPVIYLAGSEAYWESYTEIIGPPSQVLIRLPRKDWYKCDFAPALRKCLNSFSLQPNQVILMFDAEDISTDDTYVISKDVHSSFKQLAGADFIEIVFASCGFPGSNVVSEPWKVVYAHRNDWEAWELINHHSPNVIYADYGPIAFKKGGDFKSSPAPKIRYTIPKRYFACKGSRAGDNPLPDSEQYRRIAGMIYELDDYPGSTFSWGDKQIARIIDGDTPSQADVKKWIAISWNHHIELVVQSLSN
jgi:hypothetical protein